MDKEYVNEASRKYRATIKGRVTVLYRFCQRRSKKKKCEFNLTREWIAEKLENGYCELSGEKFSFERPEKTYFNPYSPSIDRVDSSKGYTQENCRVVLSSVNMALGEWGLEHYVKIAKKVLKNVA